MFLYCVIAAAVSMALVLLIMPKFLPFIHKKKFDQPIYNLGPQAHLAKQGTPNMGGVVFSIATVAVSLVMTIVLGIRHGWNFGTDCALWPLLFVMLGSLAVGFTDDYIKDVKKNHDGLVPRKKLLGQLIVGVIFSIYCYVFVGSDVIIPFARSTWNLGVFYIPIMTVLVMFMTNSANLQDGVDGLLSSVTVVGMAAFGAIALFIYNGLSRISAENAAAFGAFPTIAIVCFALAGGCIGFLRYNRHPAKIFMGDTGSMFIGGAMVGVSMLMKCQFLLIPICFTCIMSSVSVMLQTGYFKLTKKRTGTGKRIFKMAPLHHHFELSGMKENQIVLMYAGVTLLLSLIAIISMAAFY